MHRFRPSPPRDLLRPQLGSTTTRAIVSLVRRTRFEAWKAYRPNQLEPTSAHDLGTLGAVFERFLPGNPHAVAGVLALPTVGAALRRAVGGALDLDGHRAEPDPRAIPELVTSALVALHVEGALPFQVRLRAAESVGLPSRDVALVLEAEEVCLGPGGVRGARLEALGAWRPRVGVAAQLSGEPGRARSALDGALDALDAASPGMLSDLRRVALEFVGATKAERGLARRFGRFELDGTAPTKDVLRVERVRHLLTGLSEVDDLARRPAPLVEAALAFARGDAAVDLDAIEASEPTEVGRGVLEELRALAR